MRPILIEGYDLVLSVPYETGNGFRGIALFSADNASALAKVACAKRRLEGWSGKLRCW